MPNGSGAFTLKSIGLSSFGGRLMLGGVEVGTLTSIELF